MSDKRTQLAGEACKRRRTEITWRAAYVFNAAHLDSICLGEGRGKLAEREGLLFAPRLELELRVGESSKHLVPASQKKGCVRSRGL